MNKLRPLSRFSARVAAVSAVLLFSAVSESLASPVCRVVQEFWDRPRTGRSVLAQDSLKPCVAALAGRPGAKLRIHHGSGAEPALQAEELGAWLAALAIDAGRIELINDLKSTEPLNVEVATPGAEAQQLPAETK